MNNISFDKYKRSKSNYQQYLSPGYFFFGVNYWASHAGTAMWADWQPEIVKEDLHQLAGAGMKVLRVFPLWPDFQPIQQLDPKIEFRWGEEPLPDDDLGQAGLSKEAMDRFTFLADEAQHNELKLIVGLITGWMSGRLFTPPAFARRGLLSDPLVMKWQARFIRQFIKYFRNHPAILAWDLGNECNVMESVSHEQAWVWTALVSQSIRVEDPTRLVVSGMHSLGVDQNASWQIATQAELTDILTTHPYPPFTPLCDLDPINSMRGILHAAAESRLYADVGKRPCLVEEIGTLGPFYASEQIAADYARAAALTSWAHNCLGFMWWCAYDQTQLAHAPYDWSSAERELGLFRVDRSEKPVVSALKEIGRFLTTLPVDTLPPFQREAIVLLSEKQDHWGVAYSAFILAQQAGFSLEFQRADEPLRNAELYLLPCISGLSVLPRRQWLTLLERVKAGASLYVSYNSGILSTFEEPFGVQIQSRSQRSTEATALFDKLPGGPSLTLRGSYKLTLESQGAKVLAREKDGNPVFLSAQCGKGKTFFLSYPLESTLAGIPGALDPENAEPSWKIYQAIASRHMQDRVLLKTSPWIGLTEHPITEQERMIILMNYLSREITEKCTLAPGWSMSDVWRGQVFPVAESSSHQCHVKALDAAVFRVRRY